MQKYQLHYNDVILCHSSKATLRNSLILLGISWIWYVICILYDSLVIIVRVVCDLCNLCLDTHSDYIGYYAEHWSL